MFGWITLIVNYNSKVSKYSNLEKFQWHIEQHSLHKDLTTTTQTEKRRAICK
ncbi:hypothetical protein GIB67_014919, partial [Kingdonia uniflora]